MALGDRFLLDQFEFEVTREGYRIWAADDAAPVADVIEPMPERCRVCMLRSGFEFRCNGLTDTERKIAACRELGL
jgi:hypothetical protein